MPPIHKFSPRAIPEDVADLMARFGLSVRELLTTDRQNAKLKKGQAVARALILHHLPAQSLSHALNPGNDSGTVARSFIPSLLDIAEREGLTARALAWNGCPWATAGCGGDGGGCLNFSGHGSMAANGNAVQAARGRRTLAMLSDPTVYGRAVFFACMRHLRAARRDNLPCSVRLRGTDEGPQPMGWHRLPVMITSAESRSIADRYGVETMPGALTMGERLASVPDLHGYEYSKAPLEGPLGLIAQRAAGFDITASFKADSSTPTHDGLAALQNGFRLAVPVAVKRGDPLPVGLTLTHGGQSVTVSTADGDRHDHRWLDPQGSDAVAVMLRTKRSAGSVASVADLFSLQPHDRPQRLADGTVRLTWVES